MNIPATISSKGQVVIPKDIRDALHLRNGDRVLFRRVGRRVIIEAARDEDRTISYAEFKRRFARYEGPAVSLADMDQAVTRLARDWEG